MNDYLNFNGKVALVTGAGSGMGLATAKAFAEAEASVVLADAKEEAVNSAAENLVASGHKAIGIRCDVSDDAQVAGMIERTYHCGIRPTRRRVQQCRCHGSNRPDHGQHS